MILTVAVGTDGSPTAAGAVKALSTYLGHASVAITYDRYGHLMPGNEQEAVELLDAYLARGQIAGK